MLPKGFVLVNGTRYRDSIVVNRKKYGFHLSCPSYSDAWETKNKLWRGGWNVVIRERKDGFFVYRRRRGS